MKTIISKKISKKDKEKIEELRTKLEKWNHSYYINSNSLVEDNVFDKALLELANLEKKYTINDPTSPTKKIGSSLSNKKNFEKSEHSIKMMYSLDNAFSKDDLLNFDKRIKNYIKLKKDIEYSLEPKIDGVSLSLHYDKGNLIKAITRGDGQTGDLITKNVEKIKSIPKHINFKEYIDIRGEVFFTKKDFDNLNSKRNVDDKFSNPRNAASGTLKNIDREIIAERNLSFIAYEIVYKDQKHNTANQIDSLKFIEKLGFKIFEKTNKHSSINNVIDQIAKLEKEKETYSFEVDGLVIKVNDHSLQYKLGYTSKAPRWAIAYKFPAVQKSTLLEKIFATVGRTGLITYNAKLKPIEISKTIVSYATLHNFDYIESLDLREGDNVFVKKAGEIIPKVTSLSKRGEKTKKFQRLELCPSCNSKLKIFENEVDQYCVNNECEEKIIQSIIHFCSKDAMNIEFLGDKQIRNFYKKNFIKNISDIFALKNFEDEILELPGYKKTMVTKIFNSIENSKKRNLNNLFFAFGIKHIGFVTSEQIAKDFQTLENFIKVINQGRMIKEDLGTTKSTSLINWFQNDKNKEIITKIIKAGVNTSYIESVKNTNSFFSNKKLLVTGTIEGATRRQVQEELKKMGANILTTFSKSLDFLIVGAKPSEEKIKLINNSKIINISHISELEKYVKN